MEKKNELLTAKEAAEYLGVKKGTIYEWVFYRKIPFIKMGRLLRFRRESLEEWIKEKEVNHND